MPSSWAEHAVRELRAAGMRAGGARRAVVDELARQDCCCSAQEIHDRIHAKGGRAGIASVYRALDTLTELQLVQRIDLGDGTARYEPAHPGGHHHHHLVCGDCGRVEPFEDAGLEDALGRLAGRLGVPLETHEVVLRAPCDECRVG